MKIEFDPAKDARNIELRGICLEEATRFEWESAVVIQDTRQDYGQPRYRAFGFIDNRLHALVFTPREGESGLSVFESRMIERYLGMKRKPDPELVEKENPEWTEEDFRRARSAVEVLPELLGTEVAAEMLKPRGRPKAAATKAHVNIRLDADVLDAFKATGRGWQTRINKALREWLKDRKPGNHTAPESREGS